MTDFDRKDDGFGPEGFGPQVDPVVLALMTRYFKGRLGEPQLHPLMEIDPPPLTERLVAGLRRVGDVMLAGAGVALPFIPGYKMHHFERTLRERMGPQ